MPLHFKDAQGADVSIGGFFWKDAAGAVTAISEGHVKFGNVASQFWSSGLALSALPEGSLISINENGSPVNFYLAKHDYESGLNGAGRTLLVRKDLHSNGAWGKQNSSTGKRENAYANSPIDTWFNGTYKATLDTAVQDLLGETTFYYTIGNKDATLTTLTRGIFALSFAEYGSTQANNMNYKHNVEGSTLPIASTLRIANLNGTAAAHWTRTPRSDDNSAVFTQNASGLAYQNTCTNTNAAYRPAFTLPANAIVNPEPNADGSYTLLV